MKHNELTHAENPTGACDLLSHLETGWAGVAGRTVSASLQALIKTVSLGHPIGGPQPQSDPGLSVLGEAGAFRVPAGAFWVSLLIVPSESMTWSARKARHQKMIRNYTPTPTSPCAVPTDVNQALLVRTLARLSGTGTVHFCPPLYQY